MCLCNKHGFGACQNTAVFDKGRWFAHPISPNSCKKDRPEGNDGTVEGELAGGVGRENWQLN